MYNFINSSVISDVTCMFRTSWVHLQGDSCIRKHSPTHQTAHTDVCKTYHTAYTAASMRINPRGSKRHIRNYMLIYKITHFVGLCCITAVRIGYSTYDLIGIDRVLTQSSNTKYNTLSYYEYTSLFLARHRSIFFELTISCLYTSDSTWKTEMAKVKISRDTC
jgi:ribosomal protein L31